MTWIYKQTEEELWTVGHYDPDGKLDPESDHGSSEEAAGRVHWLNGGAPPDDTGGPAVTGLPTWPEIVQASLSHLHTARTELASVRDWLNSDWNPVGTALTDEAAEARTEVLRLVGKIKNMIDEAKAYLQDADTSKDYPLRDGQWRLAAMIEEQDREGTGQDRPTHE